MLNRSHSRPLTAMILLLSVPLISGRALAGPHENGVILPHLALDLEYSYGQSFENQSDVRSCEEAVTSGDVNPDVAQVWYVLASFHKSPGPVDLRGIVFGFADFDPSRIAIVDWGNDALLEIPGDGWPGPNEGTTLTWDVSKTTTICEIYWFACYVYGDAYVPLGPWEFDPNRGPEGQFCDLSTPPIPDEIADYGAIGFGTTGRNPCSLIPETGACCIGETCEVLERSDCTDLGGTYEGDKTDCFPRNPCVENTLPASWGKLKRLYR